MKNKKYLLSILFIAVAFLFATISVSARGLTTAGSTVTQQGKFDSTRFIFGQEVNNKAEVNGISFVAGDKVTLEGKAPYGFYGGNTVDVSENIKTDAFIAGRYITLTNKAVIGRDAFLAAGSIKVNTTIGRDLRAGGNTIDLSGAIIKGDAYIDAENLILDNNTRVLGKLTYSKDTKVTGLNKDNIKNIVVTKAKTRQEKKDAGTIILETILSTIMSIITAFITMVVILWLLPKLDKKLTKEEVKASTIAKKALIGLGVLFVVPIVALIAVFTGFLTPIALITFAVYGVSLYLASLLVYYIIGNVIDKKWMKKKNKYLSLLVGITIVKIVCLIPVIGGLIATIVFFYGLGLIFNYINSIRKATK